MKLIIDNVQAFVRNQFIVASNIVDKFMRRNSNRSMDQALEGACSHRLGAID